MTQKSFTGHLYLGEQDDRVQIVLGVLNLLAEDIQPTIVPVEEDYGGVILSLGARTPGSDHLMGTAFLIGPGLAMTAWHTMEHWQDAGYFRPESASGIIAWSNRGDELRPWGVTQVFHPSPTQDVCMLGMVPLFKAPPEIEIDIIPLTEKAPSVGDLIMSVGLRASNEDGLYKQPGPTEATMLAASGRVTDVYLTGDGTANGPRFAMDMDTEGGMSGGPMLDRSGFACGVLSTAWRHSLFGSALDWPFESDAWPRAWHSGPPRSLRSRLRIF